MPYISPTGKPLRQAACWSGKFCKSKKKKKENFKRSKYRLLLIVDIYTYYLGFPGALAVKKTPALQETRDMGSIPGSGRSPGGEQEYRSGLQCLENPHGQRSLAGSIHRVAKNQTGLKWLNSHIVYMSIPISQFLLPLLRLGVYMFVLYVCVSVSALPRATL